MVDYNNFLKRKVFELNVDFVFPYFPETARNVRMSINYHGIDSKSYDASILITLMNNNNCDSGV